MLQWLLPPNCLLCSRRLASIRHPRLCRFCRSSIAPIPPAHCVRCLIPFAARTSETHLCGKCLQPGHFGRLHSLGLYDAGLAELIKKLKFHKGFAVAPTLGQLLKDMSQIQSALPSYDCIIPVPLHHHTLRRRGFNQAVLIGKHFAGAHKLRLERHGLRKWRKTAIQSALKAKQRQKNVFNAFVATRSFYGESCLLLDDVFTTGATAEACAAALQKAGALKVDVLTVARAV
jgi:ComF family protein